MAGLVLLAFIPIGIVATAGSISYGLSYVAPTIMYPLLHTYIPYAAMIYSGGMTLLTVTAIAKYSYDMHSMRKTLTQT